MVCMSSANASSGLALLRRHAWEVYQDPDGRASGGKRAVRIGRDAPIAHLLQHALPSGCKLKK